jgi:adenosine kinase
MKIAVTGSIATDHLMAFDGRFAELLLADRLNTISLSFAVDSLDIRWGGTAATIAFGLGLLGVRPLLAGAAGSDFEPYRAWLEQHGVDTAPVRISTTQRTARLVCTTDADHHRIGSFYPGALTEARAVDLAEVAHRSGGLDLVVIAAGDADAMLRHTRQCAERGIAFAADPGEQLARMDRAGLRALLAGPQYLFTGEDDSVLIQERTGWTEQQILGRVGTWITTRGADGAHLRQAGRLAADIKAVPAAGPPEPGGAPEAFRAGFLAAVARGLPAERGAQLGAALATTALQSPGAQTWRLDPGRLTAMIRDTYGVAAAEELSAPLAAGR